ncbi:M20 family metallopeptidase [Corynebacterium tapiri]|uniref:M20 family metallopeptidase n=1 Tax=Corynebacterium tapiri TaxID=1448266 RepID=A0A5C4U3U1_9CORY|nr:M20/M25/M40 family metallo-hydrolase [Corynebacterium tapiri]TNL95724.1 M20 family metallopeptidase [Corynebacterium tapiri]
MTVELAQQLVRIPSFSRDHAAQRRVQDVCVDFVRSRVTADALTVRRSAGDDAPWTLLSVGEGGVLFACHTDTVPVGEGWSFDPHSGELKDGRLFGRGSVDMKGGLAAGIDALIYAAERGLATSVLLTSDEEIGGFGAEAWAAQGSLNPRLVIIPEATDNTYSRGHRGADWLTVTATGRSAHGSTPQAGVNAIRLLSTAVISLLDDAPINHDPYLGPDTINLGTITGGTAPNMVPDSASMVLDCRTVAGGDDLVAWLEGLHPAISVERTLIRPALHARDTAGLLQGFEDVGPATYFTDGALLQDAVGEAPIVIWGPGEPDQMHTVGESLLLSSYDAAVKNYCSVVERAALGR